jgi:hypothetical protein
MINCDLPKILICSITRINEHDTTNNNLLLRNIFANWPKEHLFQIFSGGSNNDRGYCGEYYELSSSDRRFGKLFVKLKKDLTNLSTLDPHIKRQEQGHHRRSFAASVKSAVGNFFVESGIYELVFKITPSEKLLQWVRRISPDIIFVQGYTLSYIWLALMLKKVIKKPILYYAADDWPTYLYSSREGALRLTEPMMRRLVADAEKKLFKHTDVPFSFNVMMEEEYQKRYGKLFVPIMHCDDPHRFRKAMPFRIHDARTYSIVAAGFFDDSRWPLLIDLEEACRRLTMSGVKVRAAILATHITSEGYERLRTCAFIDVVEAPNHDRLPSYLKGADILFLPENFDEMKAAGYKYSISSKAHLFMFSERPILAYGLLQTGVIQYAEREGWACVVAQRDVGQLTEAVRKLLFDKTYTAALVDRARRVADSNHDCDEVRRKFDSRVIAYMSSERR